VVYDEERGVIVMAFLRFMEERDWLMRGLDSYLYAPEYLVFFAIPTLIFDTVFKCDYMYIYDGSTLEPFKALVAAMPHRLVWTLAAFAGYFLLVVVFIGGAILIRKWIEKKKSLS
jgi:hypothetical protein